MKLIYAFLLNLLFVAFCSTSVDAQVSNYFKPSNSMDAWASVDNESRPIFSERVNILASPKAHNTTVPLVTDPPTTTAQTFCGSVTVANLVATGTAIKWYAALTGGVALASTTPLVSGTTYYASQTISGLESTRVGALVTKKAIPLVTFTSDTNALCAGASATLTATGAGTYTWMPGSLAGASISVSPTSTTVYSVTGSNVACSNAGITGGFKSISGGISHNRHQNRRHALGLGK